MACTICFNYVNDDQDLIGVQVLTEEFCEILKLEHSYYKEEFHPHFCIECSYQLNHISQILTQLKLLQEEIEKFKENVKERICQIHAEPTDLIDKERMKNAKRIRFKISKDLSLIPKTLEEPNYDNETLTSLHVVIKTEEDHSEYEYETPESILPFDDENADYEEEVNYEDDRDDDNYEDAHLEEEDSSEFFKSSITDETSGSNSSLKMEAMKNLSFVKIKKLENMTKTEIEKEMSIPSRERRRNFKPPSEDIVQLAMSSLSKISKRNEIKIESQSDKEAKKPFTSRKYSLPKRRRNVKSTSTDDIVKIATSAISREGEKKVVFHPCVVCDQSFKNKKELQFHHLEIHQNNIVQCTNCPKMYKDRRHMKLHYYRQHTEKYQEKNNDIRICPTCGKSVFLSGFSAHLNTHENVSVKCDICWKILKNKMCLDMHNKIFHSEEREKYICKYCGKILATLSNLTAHEKQIHELEFKFLCEICQRGEQNLRNLKKHMKTHEAPSIKCLEPGCEKMFKGKSGFEQHMRSHRGEKPFKCQVCGKGFRSTSQRNVHETIHTPHITRATCDICGKKFTHKAYLKLHVNWHKRVEARGTGPPKLKPRKPKAVEYIQNNLIN